MPLSEKIWYEQSLASALLRLPLLPGSCVFAALSAIRRWLYASKLIKSDAPPVPVVIVGGITVGGSGKTPLCIALAREFAQRGFKPGILSRGYKSHCRSYPAAVDDHSDASEVGDEPLLMRRLTGLPVVIDPDRRRGAFYLAKLGVDVIFTDDSLQHYALDRDVEIAVLDSTRMLGNRHLLPAGPLREGAWRLKTVDAIVMNGAVAKVGFYSMVLRPSPAHLIGDEHVLLHKNAEVCVLAGIGNPLRFYKTVEDCGFKIREKLQAADHARLDPKLIKQASGRYPVVMTAKDAVKYEGEDLGNAYVIEVDAYLSPLFYDHVVNMVKSARYRVAWRQKRQASAVPAASEEK